jgi:manganese-transporting P-type ATPase
MLICSPRPPLVDNPLVKSASLHNPLPTWAHLYVWPFTIAWPVFAAYYLQQETYDKYIGGPEWTFVWTAGIFSLQSLSWLTTKWNVNLDALFTARKASSVESASLIKLIPVENAGTAGICKLERHIVGAPA